MANATHLTIGTVDRLCLGEPDSELRQEVQVSITYALSVNDADLAALAAEKAVEVQRGQEAAWHKLSGFSPEVYAGETGLSPQNGTALNGHKNGHTNGHRERSVSGQSLANGHSAPAVRPEASFGSTPSVQMAAPPPAAPPLQAQPTSSRDWITKPQKLAIQSLVKQRELTPPELEGMLWEQFHKRLLVMLTKAEATSLIGILERGSWEQDEEREDEYEREEGAYAT